MMYPASNNFPDTRRSKEEFCIHQGLGDLDDLKIWMKIDGKHSDRKRRIPEQA
jgi:hypothetical protein